VPKPKAQRHVASAGAPHSCSVSTTRGARSAPRPIIEYTAASERPEDSAAPSLVRPAPASAPGSAASAPPSAPLTPAAPTDARSAASASSRSSDAAGERGEMNDVSSSSRETELSDCALLREPAELRVAARDRCCAERRKASSSAGAASSSSPCSASRAPTAPVARSRSTS
jgi:hypothetical protein